MPSFPARVPKVAALLLLLTLTGFVLGFKLTALPMQLWDESRLALNAADALASGDWLVMRYRGAPDLWNTKPPLMIWLQLLAIKIWGYQELAIRIPSVLAMVGVILSILYFATTILRSFWAGILSALVLLTTAGVIGHHVARTGDYDALLTLWVSVGAFSFFSYIHTKTAGYAWLSGAAFTLAVLTKGVAGVLILPGLALYAFLVKEQQLLFHRRIVLVLLCASLPIVGYYGAREYASPGYLSAVLENEIMGRATQGLEDHQEHPLYYLNKLAALKFSYWVGVVILGLVINLRAPRRSPEAHVACFTALVVGWYVLLLSVIQTKLTWYDAPIYPFLAVLAGVTLLQLYRLLAPHVSSSLPSPILASVCLLGLFWGPYAATMDRLISEIRTARKESATQYGRHVAGQVASNPQLTTYTLADPSGYNASMEWYQVAARQRWNHQVAISYDAPATAWQDGDVLVVCQGSLRHALRQQYDTEVLYAQDSCTTLRILGPLPR
jgi:4-amino-4-deoxy-L-arabinose transferase-like glycosyltransferase